MNSSEQTAPTAPVRSSPPQGRPAVAVLTARCDRPKFPVRERRYYRERAACHGRSCVICGSLPPRQSVGVRKLPPRVTEDLLIRYSAIGARLDRLYGILFDATYRADLNELGFDTVALHLARVQDRRNAFAHGELHAIDEARVRGLDRRH